MTRINGLLSRRSAAGWRTPAWPSPLQIDPDPAIGWRPPEGRQLRATWRAECYNIGVFPYEGIYMGWLMIFYPTGQRLPEWRNTDGFHLIQLAMTRDLKNWRRARESRAVHWPVTSRRGPRREL